ncbi:MAG TPA: hypothetical protein VMD76_02515, partial [Candidatus Sulfotelmatobacter sp.]|nr:hypothetical protein [Candidatus Sulfotelmatobacter sp.]
SAFHNFAAFRKTPLLCALLILLTAAFSGEVWAQTGYTGIFGGGPFYKNAAPNITEIENSGFTEAIVWSIEVSSTGDLNFNGEFPLTSGGVYVGNEYYPDFPGDMAQLKEGTVKRVTFSIGSSNYGDWEDITNLVNTQGTGPTSILYQDFAALKAAIPALDAIDFDDENSFNSPTTISFGIMLSGLGYHVMPDAFDQSSYWTNVVTQINDSAPGAVDGVHLQAYAGGAGNNPCVGWNFGTVPVFPGLWDQDDTPAQVQTTMTGWHEQCGIIGGFMWLYDDFVGTGLAAQYASAINNAVSSSGFTLSGPTSTVFLNQNATANTTVTITDFGGFSGTVNLAVSGLPKGVLASVSGSTNSRKLTFKASSSAATGFTTVTITGTSGTITETTTLTLAVSAALGKTGTGTEVTLSSDYNLYGIYKDGISYTTGGIDGVGDSYSANLLTTSRVYNGVLFSFGAADVPDAVGCAGQIVTLPTGEYSSLMLFATGVEGNQASQTFTVTYTDGSTTKFVQSFSDWYTPQKYAHESEAVAMAYRDTDNGTKDQRTFNLYEYQFALNSKKTVQSLTLPDNSHVVVLAATVK